MSHTRRGRTPIPNSILNERRDMAVNLKAAGLSTRTVLQEINKLSVAKKWGVIGIRTLERDINLYYKSNNVLDDEDRLYAAGLRKVHVAQMETTIEESVMLIHKNKHLAPHEKIIIYERIFKMQMGLAEIQGWNNSKNRESAAVSKGVRLEPEKHVDSSMIVEEILANPAIDPREFAKEIDKFLKSDKPKELFDEFESGNGDIDEGDYREADESENIGHS